MGVTVPPAMAARMSALVSARSMSFWSKVRETSMTACWLFWSEIYDVGFVEVVGFVAGGDAYLGNGHDGLPPGPGPESEDEVGSQELAALIPGLPFQSSPTPGSGCCLHCDLRVGLFSPEARGSQEVHLQGDVGVQFLPDPALVVLTAEVVDAAVLALPVAGVQKPRRPISRLHGQVGFPALGGFPAPRSHPLEPPQVFL